MANKMKLKIFLDDMRDAPDETWTLLRDPYDFRKLLSSPSWDYVEIVSFDHDLGCFDEEMKEATGYSCLCWIEDKVNDKFGMFHVSQLVIHSANPVGRQRMESAIRAINYLKQT